MKLTISTACLVMGVTILLLLVFTGCSPIDPAAGEKHQWQNWDAATDINGESFRQFRYCETCNAAQARTIRY